MPAYHYVALNQEQKELSGVIEAPDELQARKKLNDLHVSVVSLNAVESFSRDPKTLAGKKTFEFEAIDKNAKKVVGTIVAETPLKAYGRLFEEYQLNILSLFPTILSEDEKQAARNAGIDQVRQEYEKLVGLVKKKIEETQQMEQTQKAERQELIEKVNYTTKRIQSFLQEFNVELKTEQRDTIQSYLDQLMRIKDSTNLEHIRATCEKMLNHLQKQELFIHEEERFKESSKLKVETTELLGQLKSTGLKQEIDIAKMATRWLENPFAKPFAKILLHFFKARSPEIRKLQEQIKVVSHHILEYYKLLIFGKTKAMRLEAWESIGALRAEKKRLKRELKVLFLAEENKVEANQIGPGFAQYAGTGLGWVLAFYLISYMIAYPFTIKNFDLKNISIPQGFYFYHSSLLKGITIFLFLAYGALAIRNYWISQSWGARLLLYPITLFGFLLIVINLM